MLRNKENNPLQSRAVGSIFTGKKATPPSAEFFTDSLLEDTSRIPSPSPLKNKNAISNPRRAQRSAKAVHVSKASGNTARQPTSHSNPAARGLRHQPPAPALQRPLSMRSSNPDLITPPQSRDGLESIKSPMSVDSVPSHDLMDTYQRIYDEEELAATERESGSSDDNEEELEYASQPESPSRAPRHSSARNSRVDLHGMNSDTPEALPADADKENVINENTGSLSQDTGMSFLAQLTDKDLAAKMTPHMSERATRLRRLQPGISMRPISFHSATRPSEFLADDSRSNASSDRSSRSSRRRNLHLGSPVINGTPKAHSDTSVERRSKQTSTQATRHMSPLGNREPLRELELPAVNEEQPIYDREDDQSSDDGGDETSAELKARERQFESYRARKMFGRIGISKPSASAVSDTNADGTLSAPQRPVSRIETLDNHDPAEAGSEDDFTQSSVRSKDSRQSNSSVLRPPLAHKVPVTNKGILQKWARAANEQRTHRQTGATDSSQVDWLDAAVDVPLPSVEDSNGSKTDSLASLRQRPSADRLRRIENETTGLSFQVSESPPVKAKKSLDDIIREKEIDRLAKQAVTKSRLEAIRERDPREAHRRLSRSPSGTSLRQTVSHELAGPPAMELEAAGEQIPDTPVVIFRSSSGSSRSTVGKERPGHDRQASHEALQRFARLSATPKSSPSITPKFEPSQRQTEAGIAKDLDESEEVRPNTAPIAATPRVTGAWTDTILPPDTVGTGRPKPQPRYIQTPHVRLGGWVDTPQPSSVDRRSSAPEPIDEVTEDLTTDVGALVPPTTGEPQEAGLSENRPSAGPSTGQSALTNILAVQRARIASAPAAPGLAADDTLNLGEATIASLEDLADLDRDDVTTLIRLGAESDALEQLGSDLVLNQTDQREADMIVLDRLTRKLGTLQTNIRDARRAVGRFERGMSEGDDAAAAAAAIGSEALGEQQQQLLQNQLPLATEQALIRGTGVFPVLYSTLTLPLPLLFQPTPPTAKATTRRQRKGIAKHLPNLRLPGKPTPLLYLLLSLFAYYFLEVLLSEIYAHPLYAETYSWPAGYAGSNSTGVANGYVVAATRDVRGGAGGYGYDGRGEPEFGLVVPTLVARAFGGDVDGGKVKGWGQGVVHIAGGLGRFVGRLGDMMFEAGEGDDGGGARGPGTGSTPVATGRPDAGDGWSIMNDEVL